MLRSLLKTISLSLNSLGRVPRMCTLHHCLKGQSFYNRCLTLKGTVRPDWIWMRVVSLESPLKGHKPLYVFNFLFLILNFLKDFKVLSHSMQNRPLILLFVRITVFLLAGALSFDEKIRQSSPLFWFGLRNDGIFTCEPQSKKQLCLSRIYGVRFGEKDRGLSTCKPWSEQAGGLEAFKNMSAVMGGLLNVLALKIIFSEIHRMKKHKLRGFVIFGSKLKC